MPYRQSLSAMTAYLSRIAASAGRGLGAGSGRAASVPAPLSDGFWRRAAAPQAADIQVGTPARGKTHFISTT